MIFCSYKSDCYNNNCRNSPLPIQEELENDTDSDRETDNDEFI